MAHFAQIENGIVTEVIVAEQDVIDLGLFGTGCVRHSHNMKKQLHFLSGIAS